MRTSVDKYVKQPIDIEIEGITLLSVEEVEQVPREMLAIECWWWLRSAGDGDKYAAYVDFDGRVDTLGYDVDFAYGIVRPALRISNLNVGDRFDVLGYKWTVVLDGLALCDHHIGFHRFDASSNDWEKSELKVWLENWFTKKMEEQDG